MEEEMVEYAANEEDLDYIFTVCEIDLDYEFDAARFFDFELKESPVDVRQADLWFNSVRSYPPSPFVANPVSREELLSGNINISPKSKGVESVYLSERDSDAKADHEIMKINSGSTFYNHTTNTVKSKTRSKPSIRPAFPRASTLMKPTASQLAKQNRHFQTGYSRSNLPVFEKASKSLATGSVIENQAAKRQKLEGGLLRKFAGTVQLHQTNFVHKVPKRDGIIHGNTKQTKLRITVPRDQHLETAHRAQRSNSSKDDKRASTVGPFKALPLNRKILEAPSLLPKRSIPHQTDFQTLERAAQPGSAVLNCKVPSRHSDKDLDKYTSNLSRDCGNKVPVRSGVVNTSSRPDACQSFQCFKALPLNKKGDIGILRNIKKETTVPTEFNFQTDKRCQNNTPTELFNKLSLASEAHFESKVPRSISTLKKGSKENGWGSFQQENEIKHSSKLKPLPLLDSNILKNGVSNFSGMNWSRSKPIR